MVRYVYGLFLLLFVSTAASADMDERSLTALIADLGAKSFSEKAKAVEALAATNHHRALAVLEAMLERRLYTHKLDNRVVIAVKVDKMFEIIAPLSQMKIATIAKGALKKVRINNRLR